MDLEGKVMCLRQFIPPKAHIQRKGWGNCIGCKPHKDNKYCQGYRPLGVSTYEVSPYNKPNSKNYRL